MELTYNDLDVIGAGLNLYEATTGEDTFDLRVKVSALMDNLEP